MIFLCGYVWIQRMATYHSEFSNLLDDGVEDDNVPLMSHHENQQLRFAVDILVETVMNASLVKIPELEPSSASFEDDNYRNLTVIIHTSLNNFERRQIIRDTWGGWLRQNGQQVFFIIGSSNQSAEGIKRKIQEEHELHHDMIEYDFVDSYHNLTLKTLLTLRFFNEKILKLETKVQQTKWKLNITSSISGPILRQTQYLLKTDDDVVYHPKNLQRWRDFVPQKIIGKQEESRYYRGIILGNVMAHFRPNRNKKSKYFVSEKIYSGKIYPNIVSGTGYIMSEDVARSLFITAVIAKRCKFFPLEDVFLTGLCATKAVKMTNYSTYSGGNHSLMQMMKQLMMMRLTNCK